MRKRSMFRIFQTSEQQLTNPNWPKRRSSTCQVSVTCLQVQEGDLCSGLIRDQVTLQNPDPEAPGGEQHLEQDSEGEELVRRPLNTTGAKTSSRGDPGSDPDSGDPDSSD